MQAINIGDREEKQETLLDWYKKDRWNNANCLKRNRAQTWYLIQTEKGKIPTVYSSMKDYR